MNVIFSMLTSSNFLFVAFLFIDHIKKNLFSQYQRYIILKVALYMAVIPFCYIKGIVHYLIRSLLKSQDMNVILNGDKFIVMIAPHELHFNIAYKYNLIVLCVWLCFAFLLFLWSLNRHLKFRKFIYYYAHEMKSPETLRTVEKYKKLLHIKSKVTVYLSDIAVSPFTIGIYRPIIVIPLLDDNRSLEMIINHELYHIENHDALNQMMRTIIVAIYWFNPLIYLLDSYLDDSCELVCDEAVTRNFSRDNKIKYGSLIIDMATFTQVGPTAYMTPFSRNKKKIKKRMENIMKKTNKKTGLACILSVLLIMGGSFTAAAAYRGPEILFWAERPQENVFLEDSGQMAMFSTGRQNFSDIASIAYDSQFVDSYGNTYPVDEESSLRRKCEHTYVDGTYSKHTKSKDGSCLTKTYAAQRCSKCKAVKKGALESEVKYTKCPH